jgi:hypothetical protein
MTREEFDERTDFQDKSRLHGKHRRVEIAFLQRSDMDVAVLPVNVLREEIVSSSIEAFYFLVFSCFTSADLIQPTKPV